MKGNVHKQISLKVTLVLRCVVFPEALLVYTEDYTTHFIYCHSVYCSTISAVSSLYLTHAMSTK